MEKTERNQTLNCASCNYKIEIRVSIEQLKRLNDGNTIENVLNHENIGGVHLSEICADCFEKIMEMGSIKLNDSKEGVKDLFKSNPFKSVSAMNFLNVLHLQKYLKGHEGYVAGGCFKNIFQKEKIKDVDLFFESEDEFNKAKDLYNEDSNYSEIYENDNAIGYYDVENEIAIDLVKSQFSSPEEMIEGFDFTVTKFALYNEQIEDEDEEDNLSERDDLVGDIARNEFLGGGSEPEPEFELKVMYHEDFFEHLMLKRLVIDNDDIQFPLNTFDRVLKYSKYGFTPCLETKTKLVRSINSADIPEDDSELFRGFYAGID